MQKKFLLYAAIFAGLVFWFRPPYDPDLGWHLYGGAWIHNQLLRQVTAGDSFSLAGLVPHGDTINSLRTTWHDYHWLAQLVLFQIFQLAGYTGLQLFLVVLSIVLCIVTVSILCRAYEPDPLPWFAPLAAFAFFGLFYCIASVRPQLLALASIAFTMLVLLRARRRAELAGCFALAAVTANIHVYWVFVPFAWLLLRCLPTAITVPQRRADERRRAKGTLAYSWGGFLLLCGAGFVSPYGLFARPLTIKSLCMNYQLLWEYVSQSRELSKTISEFSNPLAAWSGEAIIVLIFIAVLGRTLSSVLFRSAFSASVAAIGAAGLSLLSVKFVPFLALWTPSYLAHALPRSSNPRRFVFATLCGAFFFTMVFVRPVFTMKTPLNRLEERLPFAACGKIASLPLTPAQGRDHVRVLTGFDYGGWCRWIMYREAPQRDIRVTSDGRTQGMPAEAVVRSMELYDLKEGWFETLREWNPDAVLASREDPLAHILFLLPQYWKAVYSDTEFAVFVAVREEGRISQYE